MQGLSGIANTVGVVSGSDGSVGGGPVLLSAAPQVAPPGMEARAAVAEAQQERCAQLTSSPSAPQHGLRAAAACLQLRLLLTAAAAADRGGRLLEDVARLQAECARERGARAAEVAAEREKARMQARTQSARLLPRCAVSSRAPQRLLRGG